MNDLVSVIIPTYGSNTNPCHSIDSVFEQTYKNIEVVVVDDNGRGTENQKKNEMSFEKYKTQKNFKYLVHDVNKNGSVARNTGANNSNGKYLCFLDDDDFFSDKTKIEKQVKVLEDNPEVQGSFSSLKIYKEGKLVSYTKANDKPNLLINFIKGKLSIGTGAPLITKRSFFKINGFNESFLRHQDWEFYARYFDNYSMIAVPDAYYDRCYKDTVRKSAAQRKIYLDKYVRYMKESIRSISYRKLNALMKEKYRTLYLSAINAKEPLVAKEISKENHFNLFDYIKMLLFSVKYFLKRK